MTGQTSAPGIVAREVCKSFGSHLVLDKVNLTADVGSILALLGPNWAGKTTMVRILSTLIKSDSGSKNLRLMADLRHLGSVATPLRAVVGENSREFAHTLLRNYPEGQWISRERERLTSAIDRVAGNEP